MVKFKVLSGKIVPYITMSLCVLCKITSNTIPCILWIEFIFTIKGLFEPNNHTWRQLNVRARPKTKFFSKRSLLRQNHIKEVAISFPISVQHLKWMFEWVHKPHLKISNHYLQIAEKATTFWRIIRLQVQIENDDFTPPNSTNNKQTKFADLKATFEEKTKFVEQVWKQSNRL